MGLRQAARDLAQEFHLGAVRAGDWFTNLRHRRGVPTMKREMDDLATSVRPDVLVLASILAQTIALNKRPVVTPEEIQINYQRARAAVDAFAAGRQSPQSLTS